MPKAYDIVKAHYDASERGDLNAMVADLAENCQWIEMAGYPLGGTYIGPQAIIENVFIATSKLFDEFSFKLERLLDANNDIIGIGVYSGKNRETGKNFSARVVHIWGISDGKISRFEQFSDTQKIVATMT